MSQSILSLTILLALIQITLLCHPHDHQNPLHALFVNRPRFAGYINSQGAITVSKTHLTHAHQEKVRVEYHDIPAPRTDKDLVLAYSPCPKDPTSHSPSQFQSALIGGPQTYLTNASGTLEFELWNLRGDVCFVFVRVQDLETTQWTEIARTETLTWTQGGMLPSQLHLALTENAGEMRVMFVTDKHPSREVMTSIHVEWRLHGESAWSSGKSTTQRTYHPEDMCGEPAISIGWHDPGVLHDAVMSELKPNMRYEYRVGSAVAGWSDIRSFVTPPPTGELPQTGKPLRIFAMGDMGHAVQDDSAQHWFCKPSINTTRFMEKYDADLVLHVGDVAYAVGYSAQWDLFGYQIESVASTRPYMIIPGNHESNGPAKGSDFYPNNTDSHGECSVPFAHRYLMPAPADLSQGSDVLFYSFDYGPVHFLMMSTEHDFTPGSNQYNFIRADLNAIDRKRTPYVIVAGHRPMYLSSTNFEKPAGDQTVAQLLRETIEPLMFEARVDLALFGHHHTLQVTKPVFQEQVHENGVRYAVIGAAGMGLCDNIMETAPKYMEFVENTEYGYSSIEVDTDKMVLAFYSDVDGRKLHDVVIPKKAF